MTTIILAVLVFSLVMLAFFMLIYATDEAAGASQGDVKIIIVNGDEGNLLVQPGLPFRPPDKSVFLPSACGGGGTCAM